MTRTKKPSRIADSSQATGGDKALVLERQQRRAAPAWTADEARVAERKRRRDEWRRKQGKEQQRETARRGRLRSLPISGPSGREQQLDAHPHPYNNRGPGETRGRRKK